MTVAQSYSILSGVSGSTKLLAKENRKMTMAELQHQEDLIRANRIRKAIEDDPDSGFSEVTEDDGSISIYEWNRIEGVDYLLLVTADVIGLFRLEQSYEVDPEQDGETVRIWLKGHDSDFNLD